MADVGKKLDELCVNSIRMLAVDAVEKAKSGHPGLPLGAAPMAYVLWTRIMRHNPRNPSWPNRDRFVLSAGHGSALLYAMLHLTGYDVPLEEVQNFRQYGSITPGHPEYGLTPGVEATTGPLGQGFSMAVGMAMAERFMAARYNRDGCCPVDHRTYVIASDGDLMEGVASEAASFAGHQKLGKLICLYDDNHISIEGNTDLAFTEERCGRFSSYGWHVETVDDGNDLDAIKEAVRAAEAVDDKPSLIAVRTHIGFGSPKQDDASSHGEPLGANAMQATREFFGWQRAPFDIPMEARESLGTCVQRGEVFEAEWQETMRRYEREHAERAREFVLEIAGELPTGWDTHLPGFDAHASVATRAASGKAMNAIAQALPNFIGGSADLGPSNKTLLQGEASASFESPAGRNIHFGVREHAMGAIVNGMALHGGVVPYGSTFLIFSDYMRPSIRLAALMNVHSLFVFTHDSVGLGEDGPTHQPIEQLASLRLIPNLTVIRPGDANETAEAWRVAMESKGPVVLALTRQGLPVFDRTEFAPASGLRQGAYVIADAKEAPALIIIATGSELQLAIAAKQVLELKGIATRVVSMPSWELFEQQDEAYRDSVLPPDVKARISIEAGATFGWERWVGDHGRPIGIDRFGASAPGSVVFQKLGINVDAVVQTALDMIS
jgi:transketolase